MDYASCTKLQLTVYIDLRRLPGTNHEKADAILMLEGYNNNLTEKAAEESTMLQESIPFDIGKMQPSVAISIIRFSSGSANDPKLLDMARDWHSYATRPV